MENMPAFAACVEEAFIRTDYIARRIGALTNHDLRRGLELSQKVITAPILQVEELISAYFAKGDIKIQEQRIVQALLYGDYKKFKQEAQEYVLNLFALESGHLNSPLLRLSILRLLMDKENAASDELGAYMFLDEIDHYFENMGVATRIVHAALRELEKYRLVEPYEPNTIQFFPTTRLAITPSGHMHFEMSFNDSVYIEQMALTKAVRSAAIVHSMRAITKQKMGLLQWMKVRQEFVKYCIAEDKILNKLPTHQIQLRIAFKRWLG